MFKSLTDKPAPPQGPLKVSDVHAEGCKLAWNPPQDDGGQPVDHYVVEKMDAQTGRWVPAGETIGPDTELKVHFRVLACVSPFFLTAKKI